MDLTTFERIIQRMIAENALNCTISGVAEVTNLTRTYWSASLIVEHDGKLPKPSRKKDIFLRAQAELQRDCPSALKYSKLQFVQFIQQGTIATRWQVMYKDATQSI